MTFSFFGRIPRGPCRHLGVGPSGAVGLARYTYNCTTILLKKYVDLPLFSFKRRARHPPTGVSPTTPCGGPPKPAMFRCQAHPPSLHFLADIKYFSSQ